MAFHTNYPYLLSSHASHTQLLSFRGHLSPGFSESEKLWLIYCLNRRVACNVEDQWNWNQEDTWPLISLFLSLAWIHPDGAPLLLAFPAGLCYSSFADPVVESRRRSYTRTRRNELVIKSSMYWEKYNNVDFYESIFLLPRPCLPLDPYFSDRNRDKSDSFFLEPWNLCLYYLLLEQMVAH
jgi:hypothetical protein